MNSSSTIKSSHYDEIPYEIPSDASLSQRVFQHKQVIAHNMTHIIHCSEFSKAETGLWQDYDPDNELTGHIGGKMQAMSLLNLLDIEQDLETAVEYEMRQALASGVDGFQFYYPVKDAEEMIDGINKIIIAYVQVAEKKNINCKFSLAISHPTINQDESLYDHYRYIGNKIKAIFDVTGDSPLWLKTDEGRFVTFLWHPTLLTNAGCASNFTEKPELFEELIKGWYQVEHCVGRKIAYVYHLQNIRDEKHVERVLDVFPAIWAWTETMNGNDDVWKSIAKRTKERNRSYTQSVCPAFYTSKMFESKHPNNWQGPMLLHDRNTDWKSYKVGDVYRIAHMTNLTDAYRNHLQMAIDTDADVINYITWNDYPEGHHLAPGVNNSFAYVQLLEYYKKYWLEGEFTPVKDEVMVFYKRYPSHAKPKYNVELRLIQSVDYDMALEDYIEVVSVIKEPAEIIVNGKSLGTVNKGLNVQRIKMESGPVKVELRRHNSTVLTLTPPVEIVDKPYRTDRMTVGFSSDHQERLEQMFDNLNQNVREIEYPENPHY